MPELRTDWLTGRRVIIAENRAGRPNEFDPRGGGSLFDRAPRSTTAAGAEPIAPPRECPFCPGHEVETPPTVYEQSGDDGLWRIRVIPNKYPAVTLSAGASALAPTAPPIEAIVAEFPCAELSFPIPPDHAGTRHEPHSEPAFGTHEVIIESARHVISTAALTPPELRDVLQTYAARLQHWNEDGHLRHALVFKNQGPGAGASLAHLHSQLLALPDVSPTVAAELRRAEESYRRDRICPYCRWIDAERQAGERIVLDRDGFVAFCPVASMQPLECWLFPTEHQAVFERIDSDRLDRLTDILHTLLNRLETLLPIPSYNLLLRTGPWLTGVDAWCHWRIELLPRVASFAGLELGTGIYINLLSPEHAAERLRGAI